MIGTMPSMPVQLMPGGLPPFDRPGTLEDEARSGVSPAPRVAIVEDELMVAWSLETLVEDMGYEVAGLFAAGESALSTLGRDPPDLVLMDINLGPGIDGIETARRLRAEHPVPILFISAYADDATKARIEEAVPGALLLRKPVPPGLLADKIRQIAEAR